MIKDNKGVTLVTVILIVIVISIIASVAVINGTKTVIDAKESQKKQELATVKAAIGREVAKTNMSGILVPATHDYIGIKDPIIDRDALGDPINAGSEWYLLDENALDKLGIKYANETYLVNYNEYLVYSFEDFKETAYFKKNKYQIVSYIENNNNNNAYIDTGIVIDDDDYEIRTKFMNLQELKDTGTNDYHFIFGAYTNETTAAFRIITARKNQAWISADTYARKVVGSSDRFQCWCSTRNSSKKGIT